jgi:hypothetical protein
VPLFEHDPGPLGIVLRDGIAVLAHERMFALPSRQAAGRHPDRTEASIHGLHHRARLTLRRELIRAECAPTTRIANRGDRVAPD